MAETGLQSIIYAGNRKVLRFTIVNSDTPGPLSLAGMTVKFGVSPLADSGDPLVDDLVIDLSSPSAQVTITDSLNGIVEVTLLEVDTEDLQPKDYYMELEVFDSGGNSVVVSTGTLTVLPNLRNA